MKLKQKNWVSLPFIDSIDNKTCHQYCTHANLNRKLKINGVMLMLHVEMEFHSFCLCRLHSMGLFFIKLSPQLVWCRCFLSSTNHWATSTKHQEIPKGMLHACMHNIVKCFRFLVKMFLSFAFQVAHSIKYIQILPMLTFYIHIP